jgi:alpha,alpha-trehalose phosphorylase
VIRREIVVPPEHLFPPDPWRIVETRWDERFAQRAETALALSNGYLGVRGTLEEGRPTFDPGVFVNGFHETWPIAHAEEAYGLARVGQTMVNVPDPTIIELYVDDEPLFVPTARLPRYARVLDLREGTLRRDLLWAAPSGKHVAVRTCRLVSFEHRHLLAMSYEVTVDHAAPVVLRSRVLNRDVANHGHPHAPERPSSRASSWPGDSHGPAEHAGGGRADPRLATRLGRPVLDATLHRTEGHRVVLGYRTRNSGMTLALGVDHVIEIDGPHHVSVTSDPDASEVVVAADARPGVPIRLLKYATFQTSRAVGPDELVGRCRRTLRRAVTQGFDAVVDAQRRALDRFWDRADVEIEDSVRQPVRIQQAVRWNLFQLAQASWRAEGAGIPAKGLTGAAYDGHYFWDTETWVLPFLAYTQPRIARNLLRFRHGMLDEARERARQLGQRGALFPWRTIGGQEASAYYQAGTAQYHLNADIAYAIRRYVRARGDTGFLVEVGAEMLVETARLWADLGFYGDDGCFHIHGVTGPDEYTAVVDDNAFTNLMARLNLRYAVEALSLLEAERPEAHAALRLDLGVRPEEPDEWARAARHMHIPHDESRGITPQDATFLTHERWDLDATPPEEFPLLLHHHPLQIYRHQVLKQADVVMAMFLVGDEFDLEQKRRNFEYYDPITTGDSSLSASVQSVVAAEIGDEAAACQYFDYALLVDLADVAGNASDGVHVASCAGAWMALVFGFGGVRDHRGDLTIDPHLPARFRRLAFSLRYRDRQLRVQVDHRVERYLLDEGEPIDVIIRGTRCRLVAGDPLELSTPGSRGS